MLKHRGRPKKNSGAGDPVKGTGRIADKVGTMFGLSRYSLAKAEVVVDAGYQYLVTLLNSGSMGGINPVFKIVRALGKVKDTSERDSIVKDAEDRAISAIHWFSQRIAYHAQQPVITSNNNEVPVSREGDIWHLNKNKIMCGDSTISKNVQRLFKEERALLLVIDSPYGNDYTYKSDFDDSLSNLKKILPASIQAAKDYALADAYFFYLFHSDLRSSEVKQIVTDLQLKIHQNIIWLKDKPTYSPHIRHSIIHEPILFGWGLSKPVLIGEGRWNSVWSVPGVPSAERPGNHPTYKPPALYSIMYSMCFNEQSQGLVYDPYCGGGSSIIAAENSNVIVAGEKSNRVALYGMELSPKYVDACVLSFENTFNVKAILESSGLSFADVKKKRMNS